MAKKTSGGCWDLRDVDPSKVESAFSKLVSGGKYGYKTVIEKKIEVPKCKECNVQLEGTEKFCPECGAKTEWQKKKEEPIVLLSEEELEKQFKNKEKSEAEILAYMRDMLKIPEVTAFELMSRWKKEMTKEDTKETKIDLSQFKG